MPVPGAGQLNKQITIQQRTQTKDAEGGMVDTWSNFAVDIWAKVNNLSGNERAATRQGGQVLEARTEFTIAVPMADLQFHPLFKCRRYCGGIGIPGHVADADIVNAAINDRP